MRTSFVICGILIFIQNTRNLVAMEYSRTDDKQEEKKDDKAITLVCALEQEISFPRSLVDISGTYQEIQKDFINDVGRKYYCLPSVDEVLLLKPLCDLIKNDNKEEIKIKLHNYTVDEINNLIYLADYFDIPLLLTLAQEVMPLVFEETNRKIALSLRTKKKLKKFIKNPIYVKTLNLRNNAQRQIAQMLINMNIFKQKIMQKTKILLVDSYSISPSLQSCVLLCWRPNKSKHIIWISNNWLSKAWVWSGDLEGWKHDSLNPSNISSINWTADGKYLVAGMNDGDICMVDYDSDTCIHKLKGHTADVRAISCSLNGKYIASGASDCSIYVWSISSGKCVCMFKPRHDNSSYYYIRTLCWSPDSKYLAVEINDGRVNIYNIEEGKYIFSLPSNKVTSINWSPDGKYLAFGQHAIVGMYDIHSHCYTYNVYFDGTPVTIVRWSPNGKYLAVGTEENTFIYELSTGELIFGKPQGDIKGMSWSNDGQYLTVISPDFFEIWDMKEINILDNLTLEQALLLEALHIKKFKHIKKYNHLLDIIHSFPPLIKKIIDPHVLAPLKKTIGVSMAFSTLLGGMGFSCSFEKELQHL